MNMNIQPAAASTVKGAGHSKPTGAAALLADLDAGNATQDFASQLEAQLGPKLSSQLGQLGQQLAAKGQVVDKNSLTQAVNTGEQEGTLSLDDNQLSQIMAAIQALPNGNLKTADASQLKNAALGDQAQQPAFAAIIAVGGAGDDCDGAGDPLIGDRPAAGIVLGVVQVSGGALEAMPVNARAQLAALLIDHPMLIHRPAGAIWRNGRGVRPKVDHVGVRIGHGRVSSWRGR